MMRRLLILGGTAEAVDLAEQATIRFGAALDIITSLAGRTQSPRTPLGRVRIGGFGGVDGLVEFLRTERVDMLIDATHPFAANISRHAAEACVIAKIGRLVLQRPPWVMAQGDDWTIVPHNDAAAAAIESTDARRVFLTIGGRGLDAFSHLADRFFLVRMIEQPTRTLPLHDHRLLLARAPFSVEAERALMAAENIDMLISRASGGAATEPKLIAARELGVPVILIERPAPPPGDTAESVDAALEHISIKLNRLRRRNFAVRAGERRSA